MVRPDPQLRTATSPDGAAILDIPRNQITTLNSTGAFVWDRLQQGLSIDQVIHDLAVDSQTDEFIVDREVRAFVEQLRLEQLL